MKTVKILGLLGLVAGLSLTQAQASIDLTTYGTQPGNSGDGTIQTWLESLVNTYNTDNSANLPAPDTGSPNGATFKADADNNPPGPNPPSIYSTFPTVTGQKIVIIPDGAFDYVVLHFGNSLANGGGYRAYYLGDETGDLTVTSRYGLSWYAVWNPTTTTTTAVPEPSTIVAGALLLLPFGVSTIRILRKKIVA